MGGIGSGRFGGSPTIESTGAVMLDVNHVMRAVAGRQPATVALAGSIGGRVYAVALAVELADDGTGAVRVRHGSIRHLSGETGPQDYPVALTSTPCRFGGRRWWFVCPQTGRRVGKLYLPNGGCRFLSRDAYRLGYRSQRITPTARIHSGLVRLYRRLGEPYTGLASGLPQRPKSMRQATYGRILLDVLIAQKLLLGLIASGR
jgi:hypothetical protein